MSGSDPESITGFRPDDELTIAPDYSAGEPFADLSPGNMSLDSERVDPYANRSPRERRNHERKISDLLASQRSGQRMVGIEPEI